jgi:hypothetical protein
MRLFICLSVVQFPADEVEVHTAKELDDMESSDSPPEASTSANQSTRAPGGTLDIDRRTANQPSTTDDATERPPKDRQLVEELFGDELSSKRPAVAAHPTTPDNKGNGKEKADHVDVDVDLFIPSDFFSSEPLRSPSPPRKKVKRARVPLVVELDDDDVDKSSSTRRHPGGGGGGGSNKTRDDDDPRYAALRRLDPNRTEPRPEELYVTRHDIPEDERKWWQWSPPKSSSFISKMTPERRDRCTLSMCLFQFLLSDICNKTLLPSVYDCVQIVANSSHRRRRLRQRQP